MANPASIVQQLPLTPPTVSLISSSIAGEDLDEHWVNGIRYVPEGCGAGDVFDLCNNNPSTGFSKTVAGSGGVVTGTPFGIVAQDTCTTYSWRSRDYEARATRMLLAMESFLLAKEVWAGALALNPKIADPTDVIAVGTVGAPEPLATAIGVLEQNFYTNNPGQRAMIHMRPNVLEAILFLTTGMGLRREGNIWYTAMDSVVSVDRGYPGTGPAAQAVVATNEWIYATPMITVRRGPVMVVPNNLSEAILRTQNQVTYFAERAVHATWNYNCVTVALNVKRNG